MTPATNGKAPSPIDALGLTLGDLEDLETETGLDVLGLLENADKRLPVRLLVGLVWVVLRRDTPGLTVAEVRGMDLGAIDLDALAAGLPKANRGKATRLRVGLARAWGVAPGELRGTTLDEVAEMTALLRREAGARGR